MKAVVPACMSVTFLVLFFLAHIAIGNPKPIQLKVRPLIAFAPSDAYLEVRVHPEPDDRWIWIGTDTGDFRRVSGWTLEPCQRDDKGELVNQDCRDRTLYAYWWKDLPPGDYQIEARIGHGDVSRASDRQSIQLKGRNIEP